MARNHIAVGALLLLALLGCNPFYSVQQSDVERGYRWIRRGEIENATTTFERAVGSYPQSVLAHTGLADAFFAAHKYGRAIATYSQAISLLRKDEPISKKGPSGDEEIGLF